MFKKTINMIGIILILMMSAFLLNSCTKKQVYYNPVYGNTNANLNNGGKVALQENIVIFKDSKSNSIKTIDLSTNKLKELKRFIINSPSELAVYDDYIFFKKYNSVISGSPLYRMNKKNGVYKKVIKEIVYNYNIYNNNIYYILESNTTEDLYVSDIDGKKQTKIITGHVKEFVFKDNFIFYSTGKSLRKYNILDKSDVLLFENGEYEFYDLEMKDDHIFCTLYYNKSQPLGIGIFNINNHKLTKILDGNYSFVSATNDSVIIVNTDGMYEILNMANEKLTPLFDDYNIVDLYTFEDNIFFYVYNNDIEILYKSNNSQENIEKLF